MRGLGGIGRAWRGGLVRRSRPLVAVFVGRRRRPRRPHRSRHPGPPAAITPPACRTSRSTAWTWSTRSAARRTAPASLRVVETFIAQFPEFDQNRGCSGALPETYNGVPLHPHLESVTDGAGAPRNEETESEDGFLYITSRADGFVHGAQTYVFTYTMQNVHVELRRHRRRRVLLGCQRHRGGRSRSAG